MNILEIERNGGGRTDPAKIIDKTERSFFILFSRLLEEKKPGATIVHEPTLFEIQSEEINGGTLPDFLITRHDGRKIFVEITKSKRRKSYNNLKRKQRNIMEISAPNDKYVVLSRENLESIQRAHPEINLYL